MVLTKEELIGSLQNEVRILLHLASKIDRNKLDYRPSPKQRSTMELLQYLVTMGPQLVRAIKAGAFDPAAWTVATNEAKAMNFDQVLKAIEQQKGAYEDMLSGFSDQDFRSPIDLFGNGKTSKGSVLVNLVLAGCAAYRTQLFLYLKAGGRDELNTMNLWGGVDAPMPSM
jgi:DinB superfamily